MPNILHIAGWGDIIGGGEISMLGLLRHLDRRFTPLLVCPFEGTTAAAARSQGVEVVSVPIRSLKVPDPRRLVGATRQVRRLIRDRKIDLLHSHWTKPEPFLAARMERIPSIWHRRVVRSNRLVDLVVASLATRIVIISDAAGQRLQWVPGAARKLTKIYNGIDLAEVDSAQPIRQEFAADGTFLVGDVGWIEPRKRHEDFLYAVARCRQAIPDLRALIVGDDSLAPRYRAELEAIAEREGIADIVRFTGHRTDVLRIMKSLDVLVMPAIDEAFGRVIVEAMACGVPVVAAASGGVAELLDPGAGILFPCRDPVALADALIGLYRDPASRAALSAAGKKLARERFSLETHARQIETLYGQMLAPAPENRS